MSGLVLALIAAFCQPPGGPDDLADTNGTAHASAGIEFGERLSKREREALRSSFEDALPKACAPPPCTADCGPDQPSIGVRVDGANRNYSLRSVATDPRLERPLTLDSRCELCSLVEVEAQLATDLARLCDRLQSLAGELGTARVTSSPTRAWLKIDGGRRQRTPWVGELEPGLHRVELRARGHASQTRTLQILGGAEATAHFELIPVASGRRPAWPGWSSLGLGIALGITGTALIALHGKDYAGRCTGPDIDAHGHCRFVYSTRGLGIALAAAGAATFSTGVGLLVWSQAGDHDGGWSGGLAWQGRF